MSQDQLKKPRLTANTAERDESADDIDFSMYFNLLLESKYLIVSVTAIFAVIAIIYALLLTPIYKADALIQIEKKSGGVPGLSDLEAVLGSGNNDAATELALLKSRRVIGYAVDKLNLDIVATPKYYRQLGQTIARNFNGTGFNQPWFATLFSNQYAWGGEQIKVTRLNVSRNYLGVTFTLIAEGNRAYSVWLGEQQLFTGEINKFASNSDNSIELLVTSLKAEQGTAFNLSKRFKEDIIAELKGSIQEARQGKDTGVLVLSLEGANKTQITTILNTVSQGFLLQNVQRMSAEVEKSIDFLNTELPKIDNKQIIAENALNDYRLANDSVDLTMETESLLAQLVTLDTQLHELSLLEVDVSRQFTKEHPKYQSLLNRQQGLEKQHANLNDTIRALPQTQQHILRMARDVEVNQQIYFALLNKVQELNIVKASTVGNIRIIDQAVVGRFPIKPKKSLIVIIITLLGGFLAVAFVILKAAFNRGVTNPAAFEEVGLTVYATVPLSEDHAKRTQVNKLKDKVQRNRRKQQSSALLAQINPTDMAIEALRSLRTSLHFAMLEAKNNVVMISGASPGVGKSFISTNLAAIIAQAGQRVLLIDGDMRKGHIHKTFNLKAEQGLSDHLVGDIDLASTIKTTEIENLSLVTRGQIPPNPSELLMSERFTNFIEQAAKDFDLVIIDTPPILAVTDAAIIGKHAGTSLMLARYDMSPLKEIITAVNRFDLSGIEIKGLIFNAVEKRASEYGYYNYGYEYK